MTKIVIAVDNSKLTGLLAADLKHAGLSSKTTATVLSVADVMIPPASLDKSGMKQPFSDARFIRSAQQHVQSELKRAQQLAATSCAKLKKTLPQWKWKSEASADSPAWAIIKKAEDSKMDLVVLGSHGHQLLGKIFFGSVAQKVLTEAACSVRIVRAKKTKNTGGRFLVGLDGSKESQKVIRELAARSWNKNTSIQLISVLDRSMEPKRTWIQSILERAEEMLSRKGWKVSAVIKSGDPKKVLVQEAKDWNADAVFLGARGLHGIKKILLGSVSSAVASRASCTVEVIRR